MKLTYSLFFILCVVTSVGCSSWALLVAGSDGYYNYRHQSDVFAMYQAVLKMGVPPQNIVIMAVNDIVHSPSNPFPGKMYHKASGNRPG
jgi:legumain